MARVYYEPFPQSEYALRSPGIVNGLASLAAVCSSNQDPEFDDCTYCSPQTVMYGPGHECYVKPLTDKPITQTMQPGVVQKPAGQPKVEWYKDPMILGAIGLGVVLMMRR